MEFKLDELSMFLPNQLYLFVCIEILLIQDSVTESYIHFVKLGYILSTPVSKFQLFKAEKSFCKFSCFGEHARSNGC